MDDILDAIVFRTMSAKQIVDYIAIWFLGPVEADGVPYDRRRRGPPTRSSVEGFVAHLCREYGGGLGGLTRAKLVSAVMRRIGSRARRRGDTDWRYTMKREHQNA